MFVLDHAMPLSAVFGIACGLFLAKKRPAFVLAVCVPAFVVLSSLLYSEYGMPYAGGGASMWPIALIVCAVPAVVCGCVGCGVGRFLARSRKA